MDGATDEQAGRPYPRVDSGPMARFDLTCLFLTCRGRFVANGSPAMQTAAGEEARGDAVEALEHAGEVELVGEAEGAGDRLDGGVRPGEALGGLVHAQR